MRRLISALSRCLILAVISFLIHRSHAFPTSVNFTIPKRESSTNTDTPPPSTIDSLLAQLRNPAEVLTVLLLVGGDVVQKAIAQVCGRSFTPVAFSFGWVAYAFTGLMAVFGDGLLMPESDMVAKVIDLRSGNTQDNESWVLGRIIRDLELEVERHYPSQMEERRLQDIGLNRRQLNEKREAEKKEYEQLTGPQKAKADHQRLRESPLLITLWTAIDIHQKGRVRKIRGKDDPLPDLPHRDRLWLWYWVVLLAQLVIAATPMVKHGRSGAWRVLFITGAGNFLALITGSLWKWKEEKFACRMVKGPQTLILTRGNSHRHAFVIDIPENTWSLRLEDLAIRQRRGTSLFYQTVFVLLTAAWVMLLVTIGGLEDHTWFLFGVGLLGMAHNVLVAGVSRHSKAHGIPLEFFPRDDLKDPHKPFVIEDEGILKKWGKNNVMRALVAAEEAYTGIGYRLRPIFFPGDLFPGAEEDYWNKVDKDREAKRDTKRPKRPPNPPNLPIQKQPVEPVDQEVPGRGLAAVPVQNNLKMNNNVIKENFQAASPRQTMGEGSAEAAPQKQENKRMERPEESSSTTPRLDVRMTGAIEEGHAAPGQKHKEQKQTRPQNQGRKIEEIAGDESTSAVLQKGEKRVEIVKEQSAPSVPIIQGENETKLPQAAPQNQEGTSEDAVDKGNYRTLPQVEAKGKSPFGPAKFLIIPKEDSTREIIEKGVGQAIPQVEVKGPSPAERVKASGATKATAEKGNGGEIPLMQVEEKTSLETAEASAIPIEDNVSTIQQKEEASEKGAAVPQDNKDKALKPKNDHETDVQRALVSSGAVKEAAG